MLRNVFYLTTFFCKKTLMALLWIGLWIGLLWAMVWHPLPACTPHATPEKPILMYGVAGDNLGHTKRALNIVDKLQERYDVHFFAGGDAYAFLKKAHWPAERLHRLPTLKFVTVGTKTVFFQTGLKMLLTFTKRFESFRNVVSWIQTTGPTALITDFEPMTAWAAYATKLPTVSIDSQSSCLLSHPSLPHDLQNYLWVFGLSYKAFIPHADLALLTDFYPRIDLNCTWIGSVIDENLERKTPRDDSYILVYMNKPEYAEAVGKVFAKFPNTRFRIYGARNRLDAKNLEYCDVSPTAFGKDLVSASAVISTAGNQLPCEAFYFGKPFLAIPLDGQPEQDQNAHYIELSGRGMRVPLDRFSEQHVQDFLDGVRTQRFCRERMPNGLHKAAHLIHEFLKPLTKEPAPKPRFFKTLLGSWTSFSELFLSRFKLLFVGNG